LTPDPEATAGVEGEARSVLARRSGGSVYHPAHPTIACWFGDDVAEAECRTFYDSYRLFRRDTIALDRLVQPSASSGQRDPHGETLWRGPRGFYRRPVPPTEPVHATPMPAASQRSRSSLMGNEKAHSPTLSPARSSASVSATAIASLRPSSQARMALPKARTGAGRTSIKGCPP
jgi:hypothetical protein